MHKLIYTLIKRIFDIIVSMIGIVILIPVAIIVKIIFVLNGDFNTIFYSQIRIGRYGKKFVIYKFRSMILNADQELDNILKNDDDLKLEYNKNRKLKNDPRVTKIGRVLRKTNIDELPQLLNVLFNQMSIIGNRPYLPKEINDIGKYYDNIVCVKPGITGLWQTSGRKNKTFKYRCEIESQYYKKMNLILDTKILFKTIVILIKGL